MDLLKAQEIARDLMHLHGLHDWCFRYDRARRRFGSCNYTRRQITLSSPLTLLNDEYQVRDTLLHEIAHALAPGDQHGPKWRAVCVKIGAKPQRCFTEKEVVTPTRKPARYAIGCTHCNWWADRRRLTRTLHVCRKCRKPVTFHDRATGQHFRIVLRNRRWLIERITLQAASFDSLHQTHRRASQT